MSPAGELRQASARIREVAGKATPGPWLDVDEARQIAVAILGGICEAQALHAATEQAWETS